MPYVLEQIDCYDNFRLLYVFFGLESICLDNNFWIVIRNHGCSYLDGNRVKERSIIAI